MTDGLKDPLGRSQVVPLINRLSKSYEIHVYEFEKEQFAKSHLDLGENIRVHTLQFKPRLFPKLIGFLGLVINLLKINYFRDICCIHARGYPAAIIASMAAAFSQTPVIFDTRGLWFDERKLYENKISTRFFSIVERLIASAAAHIVVLNPGWISTVATRSRIDFRPIDYSWIPTPTAFRPLNKEEQLRKRRRIDKSEALTIVYAGSYSHRYNMDALKTIVNISFCREVNLKFQIKIFSAQVDEIRSFLDQNSVLDLDIRYVDPSDMREELIACDIGVVSQQNSLGVDGGFPTKISEYLSCGCAIYCIGYKIPESISQAKIWEYNPSNSLENDFIEFLDDYSQRPEFYICQSCRVAEQFTFNEAAQKYGKIYSRLKKK